MVAPDSVQTTLLVDSACTLGECPIWCERTQQLWWTDIQSRALWSHKPSTGETHSWSLPDRLGSLALCESGNLLLGMAKQICLAPPPTANERDLRLEVLADVEVNAQDLRINDGRVDRSGNFVFGTLNEHVPRQHTGCFYQYSRAHGLRRLNLGGVAIPNSICFSPDGTTLYYCDTTAGEIRRCHYDAEAAAVSDSQVFARLEGHGDPDGAAIDSQGRLWSARWGSGELICFRADGGMAQVLSLPATQATCAAFGGSSLDQLFVTSAREGLSTQQLLHENGAGGVFHVSGVGAKGLAESRFKDQ